MRAFQDLKVWQKAHSLTLSVYACSHTFPAAEHFGLTSQIRRSAASIPANIAEGCGRNTCPDLVRFLHVAGGSASELEYHLLLAHELGFLGRSTYDKLACDVNEVKRMLNSLTAKLTAKS
jgi:four helix bundle protein